MIRATRWKSWQAIVFGFVAVTLGGFRNKAWSEDVSPPRQLAGSEPSGQPLRPEGVGAPQSLEQRVNILERNLDIAAEDEAAKAPTKVSAKASAADGFQIQSADKNYVVKLRLLIQADSRFFFDDKVGNLTDAFLVRRARPILEGTLFGYTNFLLTPDFASNGKTTLYDAYFDIAPWSFARLRVGKFKPPIGLEHLQSDAYLIFAERAFPADLVPNRDTGVQLFGDVYHGALSYAAAVTNGVGDNNVNTSAAIPATSDTDNNDGKEVTGRIAANPFKNTDLTALQGLGVGIGASYAKRAGVTPNYVTPGQASPLFAAATTNAAANAPIIDGPHTRIAPELSWYYHSLGIYSEYVRSSQVWRVGSVRRTITNTAGQVAGSYVLTGEDASYTGIKPRKPFDPKNGTWGAVEVTGRIQELYLDPDNFNNASTANTSIATVSSAVQRATACGVGFNWYLNTNIKLASSYEQTTFDKGAAAAAGDRPNEKVVITRWQLLF